ncbi:MAG: hypothetical protein AAFR54_13165 [Planctomycetota bacterium]
MTKPRRTRPRAALQHAAKLLVQKLVSFVPGEAGFRVNEWVVGRMRSAPGDDFFRFRIAKGLANLERLRAETSADLAGRVLELGTGWHGIDLLLFHVFGARSIHTVDHHRHLDLGYVKRAAALLVDGEALAGLDPDGPLGVPLPERVAGLRVIAGCDTVGAFLEHIGATFVQARSCVLAPGDVPAGIDVLYSESVLQRIPTRDLFALLQFVRTELLAPGAVSFHRTDQKDINAQEHVNDGIDPLGYLRHSDFVHDRLLSCRFNAQNRLRESDLVRAFEDLGLRTVSLTSTWSEEDLARYADFPFAARFAAHGLRDLVTTASILVSFLPEGEKQDEARSEGHVDLPRPAGARPSARIVDEGSRVAQNV